METFFWKRFVSICEERGTNPTAASKAAGLASGNVTYWKKGRIPNTKIIQILADYFGVNPSYFVAEAEKAPASEETGANEDELRFALFGGEEVSDETWEKVKTFALFAAEEERRRKERGIDD